MAKDLGHLDYFERELIAELRFEGESIGYMLEQREREIKMGIRAVPTPQDKNQSRPFDDVFAEYMDWGRAQGGRRGMPWDTEHATKKERDIFFWRTVLELKFVTVHVYFHHARVSPRKFPAKVVAPWYTSHMGDSSQAIIQALLG